MIGGAFLCFEGFEKLAHKFLPGAHGEAAHAAPPIPHAEAVASVAPPATGSELIGGIEKEKIKGAIRTDFILSAEIIVIALGTVAAASFGKQVAVLCAIAIVMTVGVYGLVAGIVKLDDAGLYLSQKGSASLRASGRGILWLAPWLMKALSVAGTIAMFLVGGGILVHGLPIAHHWVDAATGAVSAMAGAVPPAAVPILLDGLAGIVAGAVVMAGVAAFKAGMRALRPAVG
jgi:predicted DNA repair protein MutK